LTGFTRFTGFHKCWFFVGFEILLILSKRGFASASANNEHRYQVLTEPNEIANRAEAVGIALRKHLLKI